MKKSTSQFKTKHIRSVAELMALRGRPGLSIKENYVVSEISKPQNFQLPSSILQMERQITDSQKGH